MILVMVAIMVLLLPGIAQGQSQSIITDTDRRVILVPGVIFTENFDPKADQGPVNACSRAIQTFSVIYRLLTDADARQERPYNWQFTWDTTPIYRRDQIYAFDYGIQNTPNEPCDRYIGDNLGEPLPEDANNNMYIGEDTRTRITDGISDEERRRWWQVPWNPFDPGPVYGPEEPAIGSAERFNQQISAWRKQCPGCHFDIIAHSLGGAVVSYWLGSIATSDDIKHIRSFTTIDSPVNGIDRFLVDGYPFVIRAFEDLEYAGGYVPLDLKNTAFIQTMHRAPERVDMRCISNLYVSSPKSLDSAGGLSGEARALGDALGK
jgi:hypothetical protein